MRGERELTSRQTIRNSEQGTSNVSVISTERGKDGGNEWEGKEKMGDANRYDPSG